MPMHKGPKPAGQPRSLRSIAEGHSAPASYPEDAPHDYVHDIPKGLPHASGEYDDKAQSVKGAGANQVAPQTIPHPFKNMRKG